VSGRTSKDSINEAQNARNTRHKKQFRDAAFQRKTGRFWPRCGCAMRGNARGRLRRAGLDEGKTQAALSSSPFSIAGGERMLAESEL